MHCCHCTPTQTFISLIRREVPAVHDLHAVWSNGCLQVRRVDCRESGSCTAEMNIVCCSPTDLCAYASDSSFCKTGEGHEQESTARQVDDDSHIARLDGEQQLHAVFFNLALNEDMRTQPEKLAMLGWSQLET